MKNSPILTAIPTITVKLCSSFLFKAKSVVKQILAFPLMMEAAQDLVFFLL